MPSVALRVLRSAFRFLLLPALVAGLRAAAPEALVVLVGDQHSAYERTAQFVAHVERLQARHPGVPFAVFLNGDSLEYNNVVARRTAGALDFAQFRALAARAPVVLNLGNHEPEFHDVAETVRLLSAAGLIVIGNVRDKATGALFAPASHTLQLGPHTLTLAGVTTDRLSTWRVALRPHLDLADPAVWAREKFPALFRGATLPVVLSHAGLRADRAIFPHVPPGTLFAGAHDHLRFVHRDPATRLTYVHSGSWLDFVSVARLVRRDGRLEWDVTQEPVDAGGPAEPALAALIRTTLAAHLTPEETQVVGRTPHALDPAAAAAFAVAAARRAAAADVAFVGATTFGAGLPAGDVSRFAFDACVRFDGPLFTGEIDGTALRALLARANQGPDTPFAERTGENLVAAVAGPIEPGRTSRLVTTDWIAKNPKAYLGENPPVLRPHPHLHLKAAVLSALR